MDLENFVKSNFEILSAIYFFSLFVSMIFIYGYLLEVLPYTIAIVLESATAVSLFLIFLKTVGKKQIKVIYEIQKILIILSIMTFSEIHKRVMDIFFNSVEAPRGLFTIFFSTFLYFIFGLIILMNTAGDWGKYKNLRNLVIVLLSLYQIIVIILAYIYFISWIPLRSFKYPLVYAFLIPYIIHSAVYLKKGKSGKYDPKWGIVFSMILLYVGTYLGYFYYIDSREISYVWDQIVLYLPALYSIAFSLDLR